MNVREDPSASDAVRKEIGARIKARREFLKEKRPREFSQAALGKKLKTRHGNSPHGSQVALWERGVYLPERHLWSQLAAALETTIDVLFAGQWIEEPGETVDVRVTRIEDQLSALIHLMEMGPAVDKFIAEANAARDQQAATGSSASPEVREAAEIEREIAEADRLERESEQPDERESGTGGSRPSRRDRPTGS